jgi:hypothetical protein
MAPKNRDPFDLILPEPTRAALAKYLCDEVLAGLDARALSEREVDYSWTLYEQARTRTGRNAPWANAADLTSYLAAKAVDSLQAQIMAAVWSQPVWAVEGYGAAASRAPIVEEIDQWWAEEEGLQGVLDKLALMALVEPRGLLEISEGTEMRAVRKRINAKIVVDPETGGIVYNDKYEPEKALDEEGNYIEATAEEVAAETVVDSWERVRTGPVYRILPYRDSLILPAHARDKQDITGYGKRFWKRYPEMQLLAKQGVYDVEAIEKLPRHGEREDEPALQRGGIGVAPQEPFASEVELWEVLWLLDLKAFCKAYGVPVPRGTKDGARWYLTTLHLNTNQLLRMQFDDLERSRFVPFILYPRADRATEGYSLVGHKLVTVIEEHTAWRNMAADRAAMQVQVPIKRLVGALWDPVEQPWGAGAVIDVRDPREVELFQVQDLTPAALTHIQMMEHTADLVSGVNDIAAGQVNSEQRTLGEVKLATANAGVRTNLVIRRFQEAMEDVWSIRFAIRRRMLQSGADQDVPGSLLGNLEGRAANLAHYMPEGKVTAALLDGAFRGKPRGSVETADPQFNRQSWIQFLQILPTLMQTFGMQTQDPMTLARAVWRETLRVFQVQNTQAFLGAPSQDLMMGANPMQAMVQQFMALGGGMPGMPALGPGAGVPPSGPGGPPPAPRMPPMMAPGNPGAMPS